ncbi:MAG: DUF3142 domain-containing protein [Pyrinomonadaceae bacterium]
MTVIWAWERAEDLTWLPTDGSLGVAFYVQSIQLASDGFVVKPRRNPLRLPEGVKRIAVTRIESARGNESHAVPDSRIASLAEAIAKTAKEKDVSGIQIDFDAAASERGFYRSLVAKVRELIPGEMLLSITALASWCEGDRWLQDMNVDEAVPMLFDMGREGESIFARIRGGKAFKEPKCSNSFGLNVNRLLPKTLTKSRRVYYFNNSAWRKHDLESILKEETGK